MTVRATLFALAVFAVGASAQEAAAPGQRGEPKVERIVIEDKGARVEELRVRGEVKRIVVTPKGAQTPYEVIPLDATRDAAPGHGSTKGAAGQRVWNVLNF
jgi:hypothetical protein